MSRDEIVHLISPYQFFATPASYLIDKVGILQDAWLGPENYESLRNRILQYVTNKANL